MVKCQCIEKIRNNNGKIIKYKLIDTNNNVVEFKPQELKSAIQSKNVVVTNLKLTKDYKLIDCNNKDKRTQVNKSNNTTKNSKVIKNKSKNNSNINNSIQLNIELYTAEDLIKQSITKQVFNGHLNLIRKDKIPTLEQICKIMQGFSDNSDTFKNGYKYELYKQEGGYIYLYLGFCDLYKDGGCPVDKFIPDKSKRDNLSGHILINLSNFYRNGYNIKASTNNILDFGMGAIMEYPVHGIGPIKPLEECTQYKLTKLKTLYTPSKIKRIQFIMYGNHYDENDNGTGQPSHYVSTTLFNEVFDIVEVDVKEKQKEINNISKIIKSHK